MMKYGLVFIAILLFAGQLQADSLPIGSTWLSRDYLADADSLNTTPDQITGLHVSRKSPLKAFAMSAVIPGAGEFYTGKKTVGLIKTALEVGLWVGYFHYTGQAEDKKDEYEDFADIHWNFNRWETWYDNSGWADVGSETFERYDNGEPVKDHHYYEKLGKYPWAQGGWDDFKDEYQNDDLQVVQYSPNHETYLGMRKDKNNLNDNATLAASLAMVNHLVSGFHAAFLARSVNKTLSAVSPETELQFVTHSESNHIEYQVMLTKSF